MQRKRREYLVSNMSDVQTVAKMPDLDNTHSDECLTQPEPVPTVEKVLDRESFCAKCFDSDRLYAC